MKQIFIDGKAGTTGLRIYERLAGRSDIILRTLPEAERKDPMRRREMLNSADIVFLCLPDEAAREAVSFVENPETVVIDTSTAHRTSPGWLYGFPEVTAGFTHKLRSARRIAVPGCHASGFIALVKPLVEAGLLAPAVRLTCHSVTGYSGGGKSMIAQYEAVEKPALLTAPRQYGLTQQHKHLREMTRICGLDTEPIFCPIVSDFYSGMMVTVPLFAADITAGRTAEDVRAVYRDRYTGPIICYTAADEDGFLSAAGLSGTDGMDIAVFGNDERLLLTARYDNLGKGASGAAVQVLNLLLQAEETAGLHLK